MLALGVPGAVSPAAVRDPGLAGHRIGLADQGPDLDGAIGQDKRGARTACWRLWIRLQDDSPGCLTPNRLPAGGLGSRR